MTLPNDNLILRTDSYKASHFLQYPPNTTRLLGYFESRGGLYGETVFFGLQYLLDEYLSRRVTDANVSEAAAEDLPAFNAALVGAIEVIADFQSR